MNQQIEFKIFPKSKSELFNEYNSTISHSTFRKWIRELTNDGKIRKGVQILNTKEVETVYNELGIPGKLTTFNS